ncbi:MAG TPA: type II toxin-antitoxin system VapC family toxin [Solirubrobacterales bacterium]|nr:type II toxin-antitoxin system VapC family toxin [Solirubrobacterales bacterium]
MVVFDSWALLAYFGGESAAGRIESTWLEEGAAISSVNLGEVLYIRMRQDGEESAVATIDQVRGLLEVVDPDWPLVSAAASIKAGGGLSYADAFCIATALRAEVPLWTGDPEIVGQASEHSCEVVDLRT